jgi:hypothetical protein
VPQLALYPELGAKQRRGHPHCVRVDIGRELDAIRAAAGMYKKPIELLAKGIHYEPLPPGIRAIVIAAWQRGGLLSATTVERIVPTSLMDTKDG